MRRKNPIEFLYGEVWDSELKDSRMGREIALHDQVIMRGADGKTATIRAVTTFGDFTATVVNRIRQKAWSRGIRDLLVVVGGEGDRTLLWFNASAQGTPEDGQLTSIATYATDAQVDFFRGDDLDVEHKVTTLNNATPDQVADKLIQVAMVRGNRRSKMARKNARPNRTATAPDCALPPTPDNPCPWPIDDEAHALKAVRFMAARFGKPRDYPKVRDAIIEKWGQNHKVMVALMATMAGEGAYKRTFKQTGDHEQAKAAAKVARDEVKKVYKRCAKLVQSHREFARTNPLDCDTVVKHVKKAHLKSHNPEALEKELLRLREKYTATEARPNPAPTPASIEKRAKMHKAVHRVSIEEARVMAAAELGEEWAKVQAADAARYNPPVRPRNNLSGAQQAMLAVVIGAGLYTAYVEMEKRQTAKGKSGPRPNPMDTQALSVLRKRTKKTFMEAARNHWRSLRDENAAQNFAEIAVERGYIPVQQVLAFLAYIGGDETVRPNPALANDQIYGSDMAIAAMLEGPRANPGGRLAKAAGWLKETVVHGASAEHIKNVANLLKLSGVAGDKAQKIATAMVKHGAYKREQLRGLSAQIKDRFESLLRDPQYRNRMAMALRMNPDGGLDAAHETARNNPFPPPPPPYY